MKIFEFYYIATADQDWVAAPSIFEAMKLLADEHIHEFAETDEGINITKVPEEQWDKLIVTNDEYNSEDPESWEKMTFREFIKGINHPIYIAGTLND